MLCRVAHDSPLAVRGARNYPCVEYPGRRAPTPAECRTGYKPLDKKSPADFGVDVAPRLTTIKVSEPPKRSAGIKVADVADLVNKLKNEAKVI